MSRAPHVRFRVRSPHPARRFSAQSFAIAEDDWASDMLSAERMPEGVRWTTPGEGPTLWLEVPMKVSFDRLGERLRARGVNIESANGAFDGPPHPHGLRVSYAFLALDVLDRALERVADTIREELS